MSLKSSVFSPRSSYNPVIILQNTPLCQSNLLIILPNHPAFIPTSPIIPVAVPYRSVTSHRHKRPPPGPNSPTRFPKIQRRPFRRHLIRIPRRRIRYHPYAAPQAPAHNIVSPDRADIRFHRTLKLLLQIPRLIFKSNVCRVYIN